MISTITHRLQEGPRTTERVCSFCLKSSPTPSVGLGDLWDVRDDPVQTDEAVGGDIDPSEDDAHQTSLAFKHRGPGSIPSEDECKPCCCGKSLDANVEMVLLV